MDHLDLDPRTLNTALKAARLLTQARIDANLASSIRVGPTELFWAIQGLTPEQWVTLAERAGEDRPPSTATIALVLLMQSHIMKVEDLAMGRRASTRK